MTIKKISEWIQKQNESATASNTTNPVPAKAPDKMPDKPKFGDRRREPYKGGGHQPHRARQDQQPRNARPEHPGHPAHTEHGAHPAHPAHLAHPEYASHPSHPSHAAHPAPPAHPHPQYTRGGEGPQFSQTGGGGGFGDNKMRIIPLGGLEEVGKNIMAVEYGRDIVVIDCGMSFAGPDMFGVDYIVPDVTFLEQRRHNVRAIILTHGHLDHIGALQYVLPRLGNPPIYATKLNCGLIRNRLREFGLEQSAKIHEYNEDTKLKFGQLEFEFFRVNHSIPEGMGVFMSSPAGKAVHTGDFKFDYSPAIDKPADFQKIAEFGSRGIDVLLIDSTNALKPGYCKSEQEIADNLEEIVANTKGRLIVTSFSSLIGRINQLCTIAGKYNRKVFLSGRSMIDNVEIAAKSGYMNFPKGVVRKIGPQVNSLPPSQVMILTTGSQGESLSALTRMAIGEHAQIKIREGDTVVISASPIPGNELAVVNVINNLCAQGAKIITSGQMDVHTSGHAHQEELKLMYSLIKPKSYIPIHGELFMRMGHADFIKTVADPGLHVTILEDGDVLEVSKQQGVRKSKMKVPANDILVDGLGFGDIGSKVIQERKIMSTDGILILLFRAYEKTQRLLGDPDVISRGFVYIKESQEIAQETKQVAKKAYETLTGGGKKWILKELKHELSLNVGRFIRKRLGREPMIIPIVMYT
jgi:ribonuclease J